MSCQRVFQLKLHPLTGNSEWFVIEEDDDDDGNFAQNFRQPFLATTSYLDMLNDSARNAAFRQAIEKTITKPCHVLDIGFLCNALPLQSCSAGTGLLSMMAARAMGDEGRVTACESYLPMVKLMKKVLRLNGMEKRVKIINKRSDELQVGLDIPSRAHVLYKALLTLYHNRFIITRKLNLIAGFSKHVSEILDSELLGEGLIPTLQHAHDNLLVENALTVPYRATIHGQLVESKFLWKLHDFHNNEATLSDGIQLTPPGLGSVLSVKRQQYPMHIDPIQQEIKLLSEPFKIFEFDFWKRPESYRETELSVKATNDGRVHAVVSWWVLQLDQEGPVGWCDHWKQCVWFVPGSGVSIFKGEEIHLLATHTETCFSYSFDTLVVPTTEILSHRCMTGDLQLVLPPERAAIYGDKEWRLSMLKAVQSIVSYSFLLRPYDLQRRDSLLCLSVDDSVFLPLLVAKLSEANVMSLLPGLRERGLQYLQAIAHANGLSHKCIEVLEKRVKQLNMHDTHQKKVEFS
ncbi:unnamed protein product [Sphenostylis stenocarpa]|uniref:Protein arginine N-methyltransferase domain-containing protein n=1 Tax=Sphenostylis stenocarpa TaxID=92480 RepID=A0AA86VZJ9_9FABA|nr:unnamed protein product [Sphenostylis stenocarpa]